MGRKKKQHLAGEIWDAADTPKTARQIAEIVGRSPEVGSTRVMDLVRQGLLAPAGEVMWTGPSGRARPVKTYVRAPGSQRPVDMTGAHLRERNRRVIQGAALPGRQRRSRPVDDSIDHEAEMERELFKKWLHLEQTMPRTPPPVQPLAQALGA